MPSLREIVIGSALVVLLAIAAGASWSTTTVSASVSTPTVAPSAEPIKNGPGFTVCSADATWRRPSLDQQRAHLGGDHRFDGSWETADSSGAKQFTAAAVYYDGRSASGMSSIMHFTGLWNVWDSPNTRPKTCWTEQPQLFLFGYEPLAYDAQDSAMGVLRVRPATGYREVVLIGPVRPQVAVVADRVIDRVTIPQTQVTPGR